MATYAEQIQGLFDKAKAGGIDSQTVYNKVKDRFSGNAMALNELDNYYKNINPSAGLQTQTKEPNQQYTPQSGAAAPASSAPAPTQVESKIVDGKAVRQKSAPVGQGMPGAVWNGYNWELPSSNPTDINKDSKSSTGKEAPGVPKVDAYSNLAGVDKSFAEAVQKQLEAIRQEYDAKFKSQKEYADNIKAMYDANKVEFDAKFGNIRENIMKMEQSADDAREEIKSFMTNTYEDGMKRIALQQAGRHAAISGKASGSGVSADIVANALSEAENDPNTLAAVEALKDKQIANLTQLQTNYGNWYNQIINQKTGITKDEQNLASEVLKKKDEIDKELNELTKTSITEMFKPIQNYYNKSMESKTGDQVKKEKTEADISRYAEATPEARKDILSDKLFNYSPSVDRALISEEAMNEAIKKGSLMDAVLFLTGKITDRAQQLKLNEIAAQLKGSGSSSGSSPSSSTPSSSSQSPSAQSSNTQKPTDKPASQSGIKANEGASENKYVFDDAFKRGFLKASIETRDKIIEAAKSSKKLPQEAIDWMTVNRTLGAGVGPTSTSEFNPAPNLNFADKSASKVEDMLKSGNYNVTSAEAKKDMAILRDAVKATYSTKGSQPFKVGAVVGKAMLSIANKVDPARAKEISQNVTAKVQSAIDKKLVDASNPDNISKFILSQLFGK